MRRLPVIATIAAALAASAFAGQADAADLNGYKDRPAPALPCPMWGGFYAGISAGAAINNGRTSYSYVAAAADGNNFAGTFGSVADAESLGIIPAALGPSDNTGFIGGGQIGYNVQQGSLVFGFETDLNWLNQSSSTSVTGTIPDYFTNTSTAKTSVDWLGTARLRAGYASGRLLPYVTGGLAYGGTKASSGSVGTDGDYTDIFGGSTSGTRTGYVVGGGLDYWLGERWSARVEGLYYNLGTANYGVAPQNDVAVGEGLAVTASHTFDGAVVRAGLNRAF